MASKPNSTRLLDAKKVRYAVYEFPDTIRSAEGLARHLHRDEAGVFKTLVTIAGEGEPILAVIAGNRELDLKAVASAAGHKHARMATKQEAEKITGLKTGGISALALVNKSFHVFIDHRSGDPDPILVSAGKRGVNIEIAVGDFVSVTGARLAEVSRPANERQDRH